MTKLQVEVAEVPGGSIIALRGRFDAAAASRVNDAIENALSPGDEILVDLEGVSFVDSTGLATLVQGMKKARDVAGDLVLCNMTEAVRVVFDLTRLDRAFKITARP